MCIFEAKTASAYKEKVWEKGVPEEYQLQVQHYMAVTGAKKTYIAAYIGDLASTTEQYYIAARKKVKVGDKSKHIVELPKAKG